MSQAIDHLPEPRRTSPADGNYADFLAAKVALARRSVAEGLVISDQDVEREFATRREALSSRTA